MKGRNGGDRSGLMGSPASRDPSGARTRLVPSEVPPRVQRPRAPHPEAALGLEPSGRHAGWMSPEAASEAERGSREKVLNGRLVPAVVLRATPRLLLATMMPPARRLPGGPSCRAAVPVNHGLDVGAAEMESVKASAMPATGAARPGPSGPRQQHSVRGLPRFRPGSSRQG